MNKYKIATFLLIIFCLVLISYQFAGPGIGNKEIYDFGEVQIEKGQLKAITESINTNSIALCDLKTYKCVAINKINPEPEALNG